MTWFDKDKQNDPDITGKPAEAAKPVEAKPDASEAIAASLREFTERIGGKLDEFGTRLSQVEQSTRRPEPRQEPTEVPSVLENEELAFGVRMAPMQMRQFELEARMVYSDIRGEYQRDGFGDIFSQFEQEIKQTLESSPLIGADGKAVRGNPDYIRNVIDLVIGRNAKKQGMRFDGKNKVFFLESGGGSVETDKTNESAGFSPEQLTAFKRQGLSLDDAKKVMAKLKFTN